MPEVVSSFEPADTLCNRTYIGLLIAQFFAAFNDQAIHASAMFFAIHTQTLSEASAITLMPMLFYAPWAIFCTLAGYLADRYSKQSSLIFWKVAEVGITGVAFAGFWWGTHGNPSGGTWVVFSTVFLMGMHSAFFVPAKYGVMPEILQPHLLSRANGVLESLSFLAIILGTVFGGIFSFLFYRQEWIIGLILMGLAITGALASLLIRRMPAANPGREFPRYIYRPLGQSLRTLFSLKPLVFAVIGLAFFTFIVTFMRSSVYMLGQTHNPRWDEMRSSIVVGAVAFGIGIGSPLAGWLSGRKVELGLIPIGALGMMLGCVLSAIYVGHVQEMMVAIVLIGFCAGFYLVPLYTLLQYRAPKQSKGDMIATSNFVNIVPAMISAGLFQLIVVVAHATGFTPEVEAQDRVARGKLADVTLMHGRPIYLKIVGDHGSFEVGDPNLEVPSILDQVRGRKGPRHPSIELGWGIQPGSEVVVSRFDLRGVDHVRVRSIDKPLEPYYDAKALPKFLFLGAGLMTLGTLLILWRRLPDLHLRAWRVFRAFFGQRLVVMDSHHISPSGPVVLLVGTEDERMRAAIRSGIDRYTTFFKGEVGELDRARELLAAGHIVGVSQNGPASEEFVRALLAGGGGKTVKVDCYKQPSGLLVKFE